MHERRWQIANLKVIVGDRITQQALEYGFVDHLRGSAADVVGGGGTVAPENSKKD